MADRFLELMFTDSVLMAQKHYSGYAARVPGATERDPLTQDETDFIHSRDSFYLATVSEAGWPYVQHRGGDPGFLQVTSPSSLGFADYRGNRQLLSTGNLSVNNRVCLFLMDYPERARLKILGHARVEDARNHPALVAKWAKPEMRDVVERVFLIEIVSYDWTCQRYITPRYTAEQIAQAVLPLRERIAELEAIIKEKP